MNSGTPGDAPPADRPASRLSLPSWVASLVSSTTLLGAIYAILYQAAHVYYANFGITPEQAGLSVDAVVGGAVEFVLIYVMLLIPGAIAAVFLSRRIATSQRRPAWTLTAGLLVAIPTVLAGALRGHGGSLLAVLALCCPFLAGCGAFATAAFLEAAPLLPRSAAQARALWTRWLKPLVSVAAFVLLPLLAIQLWTAADNAGRDVLRRGGSNRAFYLMPIDGLLGVPAVDVSPCLIGPGDNTPQQLRAAVIVGHSDGRTYLVGVAGPAGFRGIPVGRVTTFTVADADLGPLDLDLDPPPWDTTRHRVPADNVTCEQLVDRP